MGLRKMLAKIKCYFTSSCCKAEVSVNVDTEQAKRIRPTLSESVFDERDYKKYYLSSSSL
jgi:hypothetical protein